MNLLHVSRAVLLKVLVKKGVITQEDIINAKKELEVEEKRNYIEAKDKLAVAMDKYDKLPWHKKICRSKPELCIYWNSVHEVNVFEVHES